MALNNYSELKTTIADFLNRDDLALSITFSTLTHREQGGHSPNFMILAHLIAPLSTQALIHTG